MKLLTNLKSLFIGAWLKRTFSKDNLLQRSTWAGLLKLVVPVIGLNLPIEAQDQAVEFFVLACSAYFAGKGAWDVVRDEKRLPWAGK